MHRRIYRRKLLWPEIFLKRCMDWDIAELKKTAISKSMHRRIYRRMLLRLEILLRKVYGFGYCGTKIRRKIIMSMLVKVTLVAALLLSIVVPVGAYFLGEKSRKRYKASLACNCFFFFSTLCLASILEIGRAHV